jgi:hypothetical protein
MTRSRLARVALVMGAVGSLLVAQFVVQLVSTERVAASTSAHLVFGRSAYDSIWLKGAYAICPAGEKLYGGGGRVVDGDGYVRLTEMFPLNEGIYAIEAREVSGGYGGAWEVHAYAICGTPQNIQIVEGWNNVGQATYGEVSLSCPQGTWATGVGGRVINGGSLQWMRPYDYAGYGAVVVAGVKEAVPVQSGFTVVGYAICTAEPAGYEITVTGTQLYSGRTLQISTQCPGGKLVLGTGLTKTDPNGTSRVDAVFPTFDRTTVWATTRQPDATNPIGLGAWAICAD